MSSDGFILTMEHVIKSETRLNFLPPALPCNVLVDKLPARSIRNIRNLLALLSRINLNTEGASDGVNIGYQLLLQSFDQALEHTEADLIQQQLEKKRS